MNLFASAAGPRPLTEENFRCRGSQGRAVTYGGVEYKDCSGGHLPAGGVQRKLIRLLDDFQKALGKSLVVTSGYRCEAHNLYSWAAVAGETGDRESVSRRSLHRAGAAADFYVEGERDFERYKQFERNLRALAEKSFPAPTGWAVWTRAYSSTEVRDPDNRHAFPYIHVHVLGVPRDAQPPAEAGP